MTTAEKLGLEQAAAHARVVVVASPIGAGDGHATAAHDVDPRQYPMVIREMIRHENDVTNHRIMWLLIVQGLIANAYVTAAAERRGVTAMLALVAILVTLSAFVMLYKSYQARGYLSFLGQQAKLGMLHEQDLPLAGWPRHRIKGWRNDVWFCAWLDQFSDLLEPYLFLPSLLVLLWFCVLFRNWLELGGAALLVLSATLAAVILPAICVMWLGWQGNDASPDLRSNSHEDSHEP